ncbi:glycerophosphodiester phosphodiesterase family protein [bacterium]|nr:glycerophosphodiester phosphodiesterase family protein [bacterium]
MYRFLIRSLIAVVTFGGFCSLVQADEISSIRIDRDLQFAIASGQKLTLDLYLPATNSSGGKPPLVVWIHGGGWRGGSKKKPPLRELTKHGFAVASISYRFSKTAIFPAQIHDCKAAVRWLRANADRFGYRGDWIAVAGGSAGGHLALLMGTSGEVEKLEGTVGDNLDQSSTVQAVIDYYGPSDFVLRGKTQPERAYTNKSGSFAMLGGTDGERLDPEWERFASPSHYVSSDDPPLLIFQGAKDQTVLLDQSQHMAKRYSDSGLNAELVVLEQAGHGGKSFFTGDSFQRALRFLNSHRPGPSAGLLASAKNGVVLVAAHRGGYADDRTKQAPENSLANLRLAIARGYDVYETDIQRTSDGVFVIVHDQTLDRETNGTGAASDLTLAELKALRKRYRDGSVSDQSVATLAELLKAGRGKILFKPDLKPGIINHFAELAELIKNLKMEDQVFLRTGLNDASTIKDLFDNGCPVVEVMFKTSNAKQVKQIVGQFHPQTIQVNVAKNEPISESQAAAIRAAIGSGVVVETHVYRDTKQWQQLAKLGVRMFHTTTPDAALGFLNTHGWRKGQSAVP